MKSHLLATVALVVMSGQALAEDRSFDWSGSYIGVEGGYGHSSMKFDGNSAFDGRYSDDGFIGGIYTGHDWQAGNFVYGVVADFDGLSVGEEAFGDTLVGGKGDSYTYDIDWLASGRARLGYTPMDRMLVYGTVGVAAAHFEALNYKFPGSQPDTSKFSGVKWGGVFGAGIEYAIADNWSTKTELLHYEFESIKPGPGGNAAASFKPSVTAIKVGLAYRF